MISRAYLHYLVTCGELTAYTSLQLLKAPEERDGSEYGLREAMVMAEGYNDVIIGWSYQRIDLAKTMGMM